MACPGYSDTVCPGNHAAEPNDNHLLAFEAWQVQDNQHADRKVIAMMSMSVISERVGG